jgi:hypothetical protein
MVNNLKIIFRNNLNEFCDFYHGSTNVGVGWFTQEGMNLQLSIAIHFIKTIYK